MRTELRAAINGQSTCLVNESDHQNTHVTRTPSTVTLICHMARSPKPDIATCIGWVQECKDILNGLPGRAPGTKQVSSGVGLIAASSCQST